MKDIAFARNICAAALALLGLACDRAAPELEAPGDGVEKPQSSAATKPTAPSPASAKPAPRATEKKGGLAGGALVRLLSPGRPPFKPIRYQYEKSTSERMKLTMSTRMTMAINNFPNSPQVMPALHMVTSFDILEVDSEGTASRKVTVGSIGIADTEKRGTDYAKIAARQLQQLEGLTGRDRVTSRGVILEPELETSTFKQEGFQGMFETMQRSFAQLAAPLPKDPIGIGAKWEAISEVNQLGVALTQTATYELVELKGDRGKLKVEIVQDKPRGEIRLPGMAAAARSKLANMGTKGGGHVSFDLKKTVPKGSIEAVLVADSMGDLRGMPSKMTLKMQYRALFEPETK